MKKTNILSFVLAIAMLFAATAISASAMLGDVNGDNAIAAQDYMMVKRYVLGTFELSEEQAANADINGDGGISAQDYMMLKRAVLGTYKIGPSTDPVVKAVEEALKSKGELKSDFKVSGFGNEGDATVSFKMINGMLALCGKVEVTALNAVVDITVPMSAVSAEYSFSGKAVTDTLNIGISGKVIAKEYSVDNQELDVKFTAAAGTDISAYEKALPGLCKTAMNDFLAKADEILAENEVGVTIKDFGFETFYNQIHPSFDD